MNERRPLIVKVFALSLRFERGMHPSPVGSDPTNYRAVHRYFRSRHGVSFHAASMRDQAKSQLYRAVRAIAEDDDAQGNGLYKKT